MEKGSQPLNIDRRKWRGPVQRVKKSVSGTKRKLGNNGFDIGTIKEHRSISTEQLCHDQM
jgi:hypothetical protein